MQKKYQVFVSSTFRDLVDERQDAIRNILDLGHIPAGMELFPASDTEQLNYIKKVIDECDYYVLIMGGRYGTLDADGISFTEREYDYAVETGKVVLAFVHGDVSQLPLSKNDTAPRLQQGLEEFRAKVMKGRLVREWTSRENLEPHVLKALIRAFSDFPATGWVRGDAIAASDTIQKSNELLIENQALREQISKTGLNVQAEIENLADLGDQVAINYSYYKDAEGYEQYGSTQTATVLILWSDVFSYVAPILRGTTTSNTLRTAINRLIVDKSGVDSDTEVKRADADRIEAHLVALGLLKSYNQIAANGAGSAVIELSDAGRKKLIDLLAVRRTT